MGCNVLLTIKVSPYNYTELVQYSKHTLCSVTVAASTPGWQSPVHTTETIWMEDSWRSEHNICNVYEWASKREQSDAVIKITGIVSKLSVTLLDWILMKWAMNINELNNDQISSEVKCKVNIQWNLE